MPRRMLMGLIAPVKALVNSANAWRASAPV